jgi:hypothetical protein
MQGSILAMINGAEVVQKLLINIARQMPEHSREVDIVKGKLAEYEPILKEVYNQIDIESKGQQGNQERHKNLGGTYS